MPREAPFPKKEFTVFGTTGFTVCLSWSDTTSGKKLEGFVKALSIVSTEVSLVHTKFTKWSTFNYPDESRLATRHCMQPQSRDRKGAARQSKLSAQPHN